MKERVSTETEERRNALTRTIVAGERHKEGQEETG